MGKRGPKTLPIAQHKAQGSYRADRHAGPELPAKTPSCPDWLSKEAKAEWKRVVADLAERVGLAKIDRAALAAYCQTWAEFHAMEKFLNDNGRTYETVTQTGSVIHRSRPEVAIRDKARADMLKFAAQLGLTASSRTGMHIEAGPKKKGVGSRKRA